jgi:hypothetical protein
MTSSHSVLKLTSLILKSGVMANWSALISRMRSLARSRSTAVTSGHSVLKMNLYNSQLRCDGELDCPQKEDEEFGEVKVNSCDLQSCHNEINLYNCDLRG